VFQTVVHFLCTCIFMYVLPLRREYIFILFEFWTKQYALCACVKSGAPSAPLARRFVPIITHCYPAIRHYINWASNNVIKSTVNKYRLIDTQPRLIWHEPGPYVWRAGVHHVQRMTRVVCWWEANYSIHINLQEGMKMVGVLYVFCRRLGDV
jgi:hypothetical protein